MPQDTTAYICPMHPSVRRSTPGPCPECGMDLLPEGTRFALLRHMWSRPLHLAVMAAHVLAIVAGTKMVMW